MKMKRCSKCKVEKELCLENFGKLSRSKDGFRGQCKECQKAYREANKDYFKEYRKANKEKIAEYKKEYREANKEKIAEKHKEWYRANKNMVIEKSREWYRANKDKAREYKKEYCQSEHGKEVARITRIRRRARKLSLPDTLTQEEYSDTLEHFDNCCAYCGTKLDENNHHMEHIIPISRDVKYGTVKRNVIPSCESCNLSKSSKYLGEWYLQQPFYSFDRLLKIYEITSEGKQWIIGEL